MNETIQIPRRTGRQFQARSTIPAKSPEQYYNQTIFILCIERFSQQIDFYISKLIPYFLKKYKLSYNDYEKCINYYKHILPSYKIFEPELNEWTKNGKMSFRTSVQILLY